MSSQQKHMAIAAIILLGPICTLMVPSLIAQTNFFGNSTDRIAGFTLLLMLVATVFSTTIIPLFSRGDWKIKLTTILLCVGLLALSFVMAIIVVGMQVLFFGSFQMDGIQ